MLGEIGKIGWSDYGVLILYFAGILWIGYHFSKNENNSESYLLGGRRMPYLAIGIACLMSLLSSVSIVIVPGEIFNNGLTLFIFGPLMALLAIPCYLLFTVFYFRLGSFTPYEYLEYRYSRSVRGLIAFSSLYSRIMYIGMVIFTFLLIIWQCSHLRLMEALTFIVFPQTL